MKHGSARYERTRISLAARSPERTFTDRAVGCRGRLGSRGLGGLYLAGSTIEAPAGIVDLGAWARRQVVHAVLA